MIDHTYRIIEIVGSSPDGIDAAIRNAISGHRDDARLDWFECSQSGDIFRTVRSGISGVAESGVPPGRYR